MKLNDVYESNSQWLKADDIKGSRPTVTIETAEVKENTYNGETKRQIVLTFEGKTKFLGLNFTNAARIAELTGTEDCEEWIGVSLKLFVEKVKFQDKMVDAIRIFPELPEQEATKKAAPKGKAKAASFSGEPEMPPFTGTEEPAEDLPF